MEELERMRREELGLNSDDEFVEPELTEEGKIKDIRPFRYPVSGCVSNLVSGLGGFPVSGLALSGYPVIFNRFFCIRSNIWLDIQYPARYKFHKRPDRIYIRPRTKDDIYPM